MFSSPAIQLNFLLTGTQDLYRSLLEEIDSVVNDGGHFECEIKAVSAKADFEIQQSFHGGNSISSKGTGGPPSCSCNCISCYCSEKGQVAFAREQIK